MEEVAGQEEIITSIQNLFKSGNVPHSFLLQGASGCGKTTLARILAKMVDADSILEVDAASNAGIDEVRAIINDVKYVPLVGKNKFVIIDECHAISKGAWQVFLKTIEEAPSYVFFAFCTTEIGKVPDTIKTRCATYTLKPIKEDDLLGLLEFVAKEEGISYPNGTLEIIAERAEGCPRKALVYLAQVQGVNSLTDVRILTESVAENDTILSICKLIASSNNDITSAQKLLKQLKAEGGVVNLEGARIQISNYLTSCVLNSKVPSSTVAFLNKLSKFEKPLSTQSAFSELVLMVFGAILEN